jgi:hypothetical protein
MSFNMDDYVDVKQRVAMFYAKYPEGSLQFMFKGKLDHDEEMIWGIAYAYRFPGDGKPSIGHAQELAKGKTSFTRGSELQNLETSAVGRAIGMLGIGIETSLASKDEVSHAQARQIERKPMSVTVAGASTKQLETITKLMPSPEWVADWKATNSITGKINKAEASQLIEDLIALKGTSE